MSILGNFFDLFRGIKRATVLGPGIFFSYPSLVSGQIGEIAAQKAMTVAAVYAAVHAYADTISTVDFGVSDANESRFTPIKTHPLWNLLNSEMNDEESSQQAVAYMVSSLFLTGNALAQIVKTNTGRVKEIIPIDWTYVTVKREKGKIVYCVHNNVNGVASDKDETFTPDEVLHVHPELQPNTLPRDFANSLCTNDGGAWAGVGQFWFVLFSPGGAAAGDAGTSRQAQRGPGAADS